MLRSTPLVSALVVIRVLAEGDDPYFVRDVIEPASAGEVWSEYRSREPDHLIVGA